MDIIDPDTEKIGRIQQLLLVHRTEDISHLTFEQRMKFDNTFAEEILKLLSNNCGEILPKARQMRLEQQLKINTYSDDYNEREIGVLNGIDRIVKLIERHCT